MTARGKGGGADMTQGSGADVAHTTRPAIRGRVPFRRRMDLLVVLPTLQTTRPSVS